GNGTWFSVLLPFLLAVIELIALFYTLRHAARQERGWMRELLGPEVENGVVDPPLLDAVSGLHKDRKKYRKHMHSRSKANHLMEAPTALPQRIALADGGESRGVMHARAEPVRTRGLGQLSG